MTHLLQNLERRSQDPVLDGVVFHLRPLGEPGYEVELAPEQVLAAQILAADSRGALKVRVRPQPAAAAPASPPATAVGRGRTVKKDVEG